MQNASYIEQENIFLVMYFSLFNMKTTDATLQHVLQTSL